MRAGRMLGMLGLLTAIALSAPAVLAEKAKGVLVGQAAPNFTLPVLNGQKGDWSLSSAAGKIVVINFDSTQCPVAKAYRDRYTKLVEKYGDKVTFVAINSNKTEPGDKISDEVSKWNHPVLKDDGAKVADSFGAKVTPHIYVVDAAGKIAYIGAIDDSQKEDKVSKKYLDDAIGALLAGKEVPVSSTDAKGCTIKR